MLNSSNRFLTPGRLILGTKNHIYLPHFDITFLLLYLLTLIMGIPLS